MNYKNFTKLNRMKWNFIIGTVFVLSAFRSIQQDIMGREAYLEYIEMIWVSGFWTWFFNVLFLVVGLVLLRSAIRKYNGLVGRLENMENRDGSIGRKPIRPGLFN